MLAIEEKVPHAKRGVVAIANIHQITEPFSIAVGGDGQLPARRRTPLEAATEVLVLLR
jgi:hypothetical protein